MLSELAAPRMGIDTVASAPSRHPAASPVVSLPTTSTSGSGEVGVPDVESGALVEADDPVAGAGRPVEHLARRRDARQVEREEGAGAGPHRAGVVGIRGVAGDDEAAGAERVGRAGDGADVPGAGGAVQGDHERVRGEPAQVVLGDRDDGDQLGGLVLAAELGEQRRGEDHPLGARQGRLAGVPEVGRPGRASVPVVAEQGADRPAVLHRGRDRPDPLDQELAEAMALGAVVQQRLPLLEPRRCGS